MNVITIVSQDNVPVSVWSWLMTHPSSVKIIKSITQNKRKSAKEKKKEGNAIILRAGQLS